MAEKKTRGGGIRTERDTIRWLLRGQRTLQRELRQINRALEASQRLLQDLSQHIRMLIQPIDARAARERRSTRRSSRRVTRSKRGGATMKARLLRPPVAARAL
jgi:hypothetical protein